jgi:hypothetical protein
VRVDRQLAAQRAAVVAVTLGIDAGAAAVLVTGKPRGDKASVEGCECGMVLVVVGVGVDPELAALGKAGGVEALGVDTRAAAVAVLVGPGNGKAAVGQADDGRIGLVCRSLGIDPELGADRAPGSVVPLRVNSIDRAILASGHPRQYITATRKSSCLRVVLEVIRVVINALFTVNRSHFLSPYRYVAAGDGPQALLREASATSIPVKKCY